jgi:hypothetical protein
MPDSSSPPPLSKRVRKTNAGFLNRTFDGRPVRDSFPLRGRQRRRTGGGYQNLKGPGPSKDYRDLYGYPIPEEWAELRREPIGDFAKKLLADFLRHNMFWDAVKTHRIPVEFAGRSCLGVKMRCAQVVLKKLDGDRGPLNHFRSKAFEGFRENKIARGAATAQCPVADYFFSLLAGGPERITQIRAEVAEVLHSQYLEYTVCKSLPYSPVKKPASNILLSAFKSIDPPPGLTANRRRRS